jgi:hypothetical protein
MHLGRSPENKSGNVQDSQNSTSPWRSTFRTKIRVVATSREPGIPWLPQYRRAKRTYQSFFCHYIFRHIWPILSKALVYDSTNMSITPHCLLHINNGVLVLYRPTIADGQRWDTHSWKVKRLHLVTPVFEEKKCRNLVNSHNKSLYGSILADEITANPEWTRITKLRAHPCLSRLLQLYQKFPVRTISGFVLDHIPQNPVSIWFAERQVVNSTDINGS